MSDRNYQNRGPTKVAKLGIGSGVNANADFSFAAFKAQALDFPSIAAGLAADLTVTVTGAAAGDVVLVAPAAAALAAGASLYGFVSAANTVTVRACNNTAGALDLASATYNVVVLRVA